MNNNANPAILRTLIAYAVIVPLAICIGFLLASVAPASADNSNWVWSILVVINSHPIVWGSIALVLFSPLLLRWHYWLLLVAFNASITIFFMPGQPGLWMLTVALSLGISVLSRMLNNQKHFIRAPQITWPLICILAVVFFTAEMTGGFGLRSFGSDVYGGKKYVMTYAAVAAYFAFTAQRIPPRRAGLAVALFFLGGTTALIGDFSNVMPSSLNFIFLVFPRNIDQSAGSELGVTRFGGAAMASPLIISYMLARYGIRGIFISGRPWRLVAFIAFMLLGFLGGYRGGFILIGMTFLIQFYLEKLHRTVLLPALVLTGALAMLVMIPLASKLPFTFQRELSFLPLPVDSMARQSADATLEWRFEMWRALLPQVPEYLLLGKGYGFSSLDFQYMGDDSAFRSVDPSQQGLALSGDYHNGWLSVIITFGIWGIAATLWFFVAGWRALYDNCRYGDPNLKTVNCFLLASFLARILMFMTVSGSGLHSDLLVFVGMLGLSISLNGGIRRPSDVPVQTEAQTLIPARPRLLPFYQP